VEVPPTVFEILTIKAGNQTREGGDKQAIFQSTPPLFDARLGSPLPIEFLMKQPVKTRGMAILYG